MNTILSAPAQIADALRLPGGTGGRRFCPECQTGTNHKTPDLSLQETGFRCFKCGIHGNLIELVKVTLGIDFPAALEWLRARGFTDSPVAMPRNPAPVAVPLPTPGAARLDRLLVAGIACLAAHPESLARRGLSVDIVGRFQIGHLPTLTFPEWRGRSMEDVWILPILAPDGSDYCAVKLHSDSPGEGFKCAWAPIGTTPANRPRHGLNAYFPHPAELYAPVAEDYGDDVHDNVIRPAHPWEVTPDDPDREIFLCPGELKAAAVMSAGLPALSMTGGESAKLTPDLAEWLRGMRIVLVYDDDDAGRSWRDRLGGELVAVAASVEFETLGRMDTNDKH